MLLMIITSLTILPWDPAAQCLPLTTRAVRWNPPPPGRVWGGLSPVVATPPRPSHLSSSGSSLSCPSAAL